MNKDTYILKTGEDASSALEFQHKVFAKDSDAHLRSAGISAGKIVWDIGCGSGTMTEFLARSVGKTGHVYALDVSLDQINVSKKRLIQAGLENVTFIQGDITSLKDLPIGKADIVYARLVLMHLAEPEEAIKNMCLLLKPDGILALQESITSTTHASIRSAELEDYMKVFIGLSKYKGVDFDIGAKLQELCKKVGFKEVKAYYLQHKLSAQQAKAFLLNRSAEWEDEAIKAGIITKEKMEQCKLAIQLLPEYDASFYYALSKQAYILAWNP